MNENERLESRRLLSFTPFGEEGIVADSSAASAFDVAVAGNGSFIVASIQHTPGDGPALTAVRYSPAGVQIGEPLTLALGVGGEVSAAMAADGDSVIVYRKPGVRAVRISRAGVVSESMPISTSGSVGSSDVAMDDAGGFFVTWFQGPDDGPDAIQVHAFNADASQRAAQFTAETLDIVEGGIDIDIAAQPDGSSAVLAYQYHGSDGNSYLGGNRVSPSALTGAMAIMHSDQAAGADVAVNADGTFVIGYTQFADDPSGNVTSQSGFARRFNAAGAAQGDA